MRQCRYHSPFAEPLIAHEIAHTFVRDKDCRSKAILAENKAREWGFGAEMDCKESEKERLNPNKSGTGGSRGFIKMLLKP